MDTANCYIDGWYAQKQGESLAANPCKDKDERAAWEDGWIDSSQAINSYTLPNPTAAGW